MMDMNLYVINNATDQTEEEEEKRMIVKAF